MLSVLASTVAFYGPVCAQSPSPSTVTSMPDPCSSWRPACSEAGCSKCVCRGLLSLMSALRSLLESCLTPCCTGLFTSCPEPPACVRSALDCLLPTLCEVAMAAEMSCTCAGDDAHETL